MSIMRWPVYVWGDGKRWHLWARKDEDAAVLSPMPEILDEGYPDFAGGIAIKEKVFDAIVLRRVAQLLYQPKALKRAEKYLIKQGHSETARDIVADIDRMGERRRKRFKKANAQSRANVRGVSPVVQTGAP